MAIGSDGGSRVSISADLRVTIQKIRAFTGKQHSDEDILAVFKDCFNDPHETAQKLLSLDAFQEVKSKKDRKKENSVATISGQGKYGRKNYSLKYSTPDARGGKNPPSRRDNGVNHNAGSSKPLLPAPQKARNKAAPRAINVVNGTVALSNGINTHKRVDGPTNNVTKPDTNNVIKPVIGKEPPSKTRPEVIIEPEKPKKSSDLSHAPMSYSVVLQNHGQAVKKAPIDNNTVIMPVAKLQQSEPLSSSSSCNNKDVTSDATLSHPSIQGIRKEAVKNVKEAETQLLTELNSADRLHVTFPLHFQAVEVLKSYFTFGSFGSTSASKANPTETDNEGWSLNGKSSKLMEHKVKDSSPGKDELAENPSFSKRVSTAAQESDHINSLSVPASEQRKYCKRVSTAAQESDHINSLSVPASEQLGESERIISPSEDADRHELKQETVSKPETHTIPSLQNAPTIYSTNAPAQSETSGIQTGSFKNPVSSSQIFTDQSTIPPFQHQLHLFSQPAPPNYFPYGPYYSPYYMPHINQFLGPNGLPLQPYPSQFKPGTNTGNAVHAGLPSAYGSYSTSPSVLKHLPSATSIDPTLSEDLTASQRGNTCTTGPQIEDTASWLQNLSIQQVNSLYNLPPLQGQHPALALMQAGQGGYAGIYPRAQAMAALSTATAETIQHPPLAYQQPPQLAQSNWNGNH